MRQKRQHFRSQIRREAINQIFKDKRQKFLNSSHQHSFTLEIIQSIKEEALSQLTRFALQIQDALNREDESQICTSLKQSAFFLKTILRKSQNIPECLKTIVDTWASLGYEKLMYRSIQIYLCFGRQNFAGIRKQTFKSALRHYSLVYVYFDFIQKKQDFQSDDMFKILFIIMSEVEHEPEEVYKIMEVLNAMFFSPKIVHQFFFNNKLQNYNEGAQKICFDHLISNFYNNRERLQMPNNEHQQKKFHKLSIYFIEFINLLFKELKQLEQCIERSLKKGSNGQILAQSKETNQTYENTLKLREFPKEVTLRLFFDKSQIKVIYDFIEITKHTNYNIFANENQRNTEDLGYCIEALRGFLEYYPHKKYLKKCEEELEFLVDRLVSKEYGLILKQEILYLLDTVIYIDQENQITENLIKNHNLFQVVWTFNDRETYHVKLNIMNNLMLTDEGFRVVMRYMNEIRIDLEATKAVTLAQTFCLHYFLATKYCMDEDSKFSLVLDILYSLNLKDFGVVELERDFYIFNHLYEKGLRLRLPERYLRYELNDLEGENKNEKVREQLMEEMRRLEKEYLGFDDMEM